MGYIFKKESPIQSMMDIIENVSLDDLRASIVSRKPLEIENKARARELREERELREGERMRSVC